MLLKRAGKGGVFAPLAMGLVLIMGSPAPTSAAPGEFWRDAQTGLTNFSPYPLPARYDHTSVVFKDRMWVIGGESDNNRDTYSDVWHSEDGATWIQATTSSVMPARSGHSCVVFKDRLWVIAGADDNLELNDVWASSDGVTWEQMTDAAPFSPRTHHASAVFNNRIWVIGGVNGTTSYNDVWSSADGIHWDQVTSAADFSPRSGHTATVFKNRLWVINGMVERGNFTDEILNDVWFTLDGEHWVQAARDIAYFRRWGHTTVVHDNRIWMIAGLAQTGSHEYDRVNDVWSSADGLTWQQAKGMAFAPRSGYSGVVFEGRIWITGGQNLLGIFDDVWSSADGLTWTTPGTAPLPVRKGHSCVAFNNRIWVIGGWRPIVDTHSDVWYLENGAWKQVLGAAPFGPMRDHSSVVFKDRIWVIGGYGVWSSPDGLAWESMADSPGFRPRYHHTTVVFNDEMWLIGGGSRTNADDHNVGGANDVWHTSDGASWTRATKEAAFSPRFGHSCVVFNNRLWVIGGRSPTSGRLNDVWSSADGVTWEQATATAAFSKRYGHVSVVINDRMWVIGGNVGGPINDVWSSANGVTWVREDETAGFAPRTEHTGVMLNDRIWLVGGSDSNSSGSFRNDVCTSADGVNWEQATGVPNFPNRSGDKGVVFGDEIWSIEDYFSDRSHIDVWTTGDGIAWHQKTGAAALNPRQGFSTIAFNDRLWVIAGLYEYTWLNDVWSTPDGTTWEQATAAAAFSPRFGHASFIFNNRMWVIGGERRPFDADSVYYNDVWSSADGVSWEQATGSAAFSPRTLHSCVVFNDRIWLIGGLDGDRSYNDVWSSADGITWELAAESPAFSPRYGHAGVVYRDRIWLMSGWGEGESIWDEVWTSADGLEWELASRAASFSTRYGHAGVVFNDKVWLIGGLGSDDDTNEVWCAGVNPHADVVPAALDFSPRGVGVGPTPPRRAKLLNRYPEAWEHLEITGIAIEDDATGAFAFAEPPDTSLVPVGMQRDLSIIFDPTVVGPATAKLVIQSNDPARPVLIVPLSGRGLNQSSSSVSDWRDYD